MKWHRDSDKAESVKVIRELCGTLIARRVPKGMLVTTRKYLSPQSLMEIADIEASPIAPSILHIASVHYERILEMLALSLRRKLAGFSRLQAIF